MTSQKFASKVGAKGKRELPRRALKVLAGIQGGVSHATNSAKAKADLSL